MSYQKLVLLSCLLVLGGCGSVSSRGGGGCCGVPGINVQIVSPVPPAAVDDNVGQAIQMTVQVTGDSSNAGVSWTVAPAIHGGPVGTLSDQQALTATYTPPAGVTSPAQVTVTATSITDPTRSAAIPITVYPPLVPVTTSSDLATAFLNTDYTCILLPITFAGVTQVPCEVSVAGGTGPYSWSLGNTLLPQGLQLAPGLDQLSTEIVGSPIATGVYPFNITASDATGNSTTASLSISVAPTQLKVVTPTLMAPVPSTPYGPVQPQASSGVPPYTWTLAYGSGPLPPGMTLTPAGVLSGTPPADFSSSYSFALQVADSQSPVPAQAIFPAPQPAANSPKVITLGLGDSEDLHPCQSTNTSIQPNTPYAFVFSGFDLQGPVTYSGSFVSDLNGNLSGIEDIIRSGAAQLAQPLVSGSSILFNELGRGCLILTTASSSSQFRLAPTTLSTTYTEGRLVEFDDTNGQGTRGSGSFHIQNAAAFAASLAGPVIFRFSGWDANENHFAMAGSANGQPGLFTSLAADVNDNGIVAGPFTGDSGTLGTPDTNGRGVATLNIGANSYELVYYVLDVNHLIFNSTHSAASAHPLVTGETIAAAAPFSQATLSNSHIYRFGGSIPGSPDVGVGVVHFDGSGAASGTAFERSGGTISTTSLSAQYSVDPITGRFTFSGTGVPVVGYATQKTTGVTAFLVGTGSSAASGTMEFQTDSYPPGYQFGPISGHYGLGTEEMLDSQTSVIAGTEDPGPSGSISTASPGSYLDSSSLTGLIPFQEFDLFKYTWIADGSGTYSGNTFMVTNQSKFFYLDASPLNGHPSIVVGQIQQ